MSVSCKPLEAWNAEARHAKDTQKFTAKLHLLDGKKPAISNESDANEILSALKARNTFEVT